MDYSLLALRKKRIRDFLRMHYINWHFTYLLTAAADDDAAAAAAADADDDDDDDDIGDTWYVTRMTGGELFEYLASREKVDEATATMFLRQVLEGVCHLHQKNIVHLDLKVSRSFLRSLGLYNWLTFDLWTCSACRTNERTK